MEQSTWEVKEDTLSEILSVPEKVSSNEGSDLSGKDAKAAVVEVESEPQVDVADVSEIEPEIYVNGRHVSKAEFEKIDPEDIESIRVDKAGKKIEVMLLPRGKAGEKKKDTPVKEMSYKTSTKKGSPTIIIEDGWEDNMTFVAGDGMKVTVAPTSKQGNNKVSIIQGTGSNVRYYIGDKEASEEEVNRLSSDMIKNIRVSKEEGEHVVYLELKKVSRKSHRETESGR